ncbi:MAG: glycerate kinase [Clostridiaceae bacterium]|nr:glycerate kinase [Clostridiaceae bacterium]
MKKIILAPDSFKGTMGASEICDIMAARAAEAFPKCEIIKIPVADGGEGTVDSMLIAAGGRRVHLKVKGPRFGDIDSFYGILPGEKTAVIEMAAAAGLPMVKGSENPMDTTTFGVGQLIAHAVKNGVCNILLGLGGSCTNDGGCGAAAALGVVFTDEQGKVFIPMGGTLDKISGIDLSGAAELMKNVRVKIMCDVNNPLCGENGAARIFGPQKGADEHMVDMLDRGLAHLGHMLEKIEGCADIMSMPGAGAAGGMGAGLCSMLGAELVSGIDGVLDAVGFEEILDGCDMVLTGEGRIDKQSLGGKVISGICRRASSKAVPVCAVVGDASDSELGTARDIGLWAVFTTNRKAVSWKEAKVTAKADLDSTMLNIFSFVRAVEESYRIQHR